MDEKEAEARPVMGTIFLVVRAGRSRCLGIDRWYGMVWYGRVREGY